MMVLSRKDGYARLFFLLFTATILLNKGICSKNELALRQFLLKSQHLQEIRPIKNDSDTVVVTLGLTLSQIIDLDAKHQILKIGAFVRQIWSNPYFKWDPKQFGGLTTINIDPTEMWLPDITLYNTADSGDENLAKSLDGFTTRVIVHHSGRVVWLAPATFHSKCKVDIKYFPFDKQTCKMKFGSWTFDGNRLDIQSESDYADLSKFNHHVEWRLMTMTAKRNVVKYICCEEPYPDVTFTLTVKRRTLYYLINLIAPLVILTFLTCMTFIVPFESGERVSLAITVLLSMTVFMLLVQEMIPSTSETMPLIGRFYTAAFFEIAFAVVVCCINLSLYFTNPVFTKMPSWMSTITRGRLAKWLGVKIAPHPPPQPIQLDINGTVTPHGTPASNRELKNDENQDEETDPRKAAFQKIKCYKRSSENNCNYYNYEDVYYHVLTSKEKELNKDSMDERRSNTTSEFQDKLDAIATQLENLLKFEKKDEQRSFEENEWKRIAIIFDKLSLYLFIIIFTLTTVLIFGQAPEYVP